MGGQRRLGLFFSLSFASADGSSLQHLYYVPIDDHLYVFFGNKLEYIRVKKEMVVLTSVIPLNFLGVQ